MVSVQDVRERISTQMNDTVIQKFIKFYEIIALNHLRAKPSSPMIEKIKANKLAWLSFRASNVMGVTRLKDNKPIVDFTFEGRVVEGLQPNLMYEIQYEIQDYDSLQIVLDEVVTIMVVQSVIRANQYLKGLGVQSETIGDYSYTLSPEMFDDRTMNRKIMSPLNNWVPRGASLAK